MQCRRRSNWGGAREGALGYCGDPQLATSGVAKVTGPGSLPRMPGRASLLFCRRFCDCTSYRDHGLGGRVPADGPNCRASRKPSISRRSPSPRSLWRHHAILRVAARKSIEGMNEILLFGWTAACLFKVSETWFSRRTPIRRPIDRESNRLRCGTRHRGHEDQSYAAMNACPSLGGLRLTRPTMAGLRDLLGEFGARSQLILDEAHPRHAPDCRRLRAPSVPVGLAA